MNSFPYESWSDAITDFWPWGGHGSTGTYVLTALGIAFVATALVWWAWLERRRLERAAAAFRESEAMGAGEP